MKLGGRVCWTSLFIGYDLHYVVVVVVVVVAAVVVVLSADSSLKM